MKDFRGAVGSRPRIDRHYTDSCWRRIGGADRNVLPPPVPGKTRAATSMPHAGEEGGQAVSKSSSRKVTSPKVASKASKALQDGRTSPNTKSIAASALAQARSKKK